MAAEAMAALARVPAALAPAAAATPVPAPAPAPGAWVWVCFSFGKPCCVVEAGVYAGGGEWETCILWMSSSMAAVWVVVVVGFVRP